MPFVYDAILRHAREQDDVPVCGIFDYIFYFFIAKNLILVPTFKFTNFIFDRNSNKIPFLYMGISFGLGSARPGLANFKRALKRFFGLETVSSLFFFFFFFSSLSLIIVQKGTLLSSPILKP